MPWLHYTTSSAKKGIKLSKLKALGLTALAVSTIFVSGYWVGAQKEEEKRFTEPLHSVFIMSCTAQDIPVDVCLCSETKLYKLEPQIQQGQQIFQEFLASVDQCTEEIVKELY